MGLKPALYLLLILVLSYQSANAELQTPVQTYVRCHFLLTGERPSFRSQEIRKIKKGDADPIELCIDLLDDSVLGSNGRPNVNNKKTKQVLQNMSRLHYTWFSERTGFRTTFSSNENLYDSLEPALHWTRALLHPNAKVQEVLTRNRHLRGLKQKDPSIQDGYAPLNGRKNHISLYLQSDPSDALQAQPWGAGKFIETGKLVGIADMPVRKINAASFVSIVPGERNESDFITLPGVDLKNINIYKMLGGGVIGSPTYLDTSIATEKDFRGFDGEKLPRLWAKAVYKDFLCKDLPTVLRQEDARKYIDSRPNAFTFRQESCVSCHAAIDPMTGNMRNLFRPFNTRLEHQVSGEISRRFTVNTLYSPSKQFAGWPKSRDSNFYLRKPKGRLKFRNYRGKLVEKNTDDLNDLGQKIAAQDDFYVCAAKRYYKHFMHVDVNLNDPGSDKVPKGNSTDQYHRKRVIQLGQQLKNSGRLIDIVKEILRYEDFRKLDVGVSQNE